MLALAFLLAASWPWNANAAQSAVDILQEFFLATGGPDHWNEDVKNGGWTDPNASACSYTGITCENDNDDNSIVRIDLPGANLVGSVPSSLWRLSSLVHVNMRSNALTDAGWSGLGGSVSPVEVISFSDNHLRKMDNVGAFGQTLRSLNLNKNQIDTEFPSGIQQLKEMESLYLAFNQLQGSLPTSIGQLTALKELYLFSNRLRGPLPSELGMLNACQILGLGHNQFSGTLPTELDNLVNMRDLSLHPDRENGVKDGEVLTGPLLSFGNMPFLTLLFLDGNRLSGTIPNDFLRHNENIDLPVTIGLTDNRIGGTLPRSLERFSSLTIDLVGNNVSHIPSELCSIGGWMGGLVESYGCDAILCPPGKWAVQGRATSDESLCKPCENDNSPMVWGSTECVGNHIDDGDASTESWMLLGKFYLSTSGSEWTNQDGWDTFSDVAMEDLTEDRLGSLGLDVCDGWYGIICNEDGEVTEISLPKNGLYGTIPSSIFALPKLAVFDVSGNNVDITSFRGFQQASDTLIAAVLSNTKIHAMEGLGGLTNLRLLYLDGISTTQALPSELFALTGLKILHLQHGGFSGVLPTEIGKLSELEMLNLYGNNVTGPLPSELGQLSNLQSIDLSENEFSGELPLDALAKWTHMTHFAIHNSKEEISGLTGPIPSFVEWENLQDINLAGNSFNGELPANFLAGVADKVQAIQISLEHNHLTGSIPVEGLSQLSKLTINLEGNMIDSIPPELCQMHDWMGGQVGLMASLSTQHPSLNPCDAILCPPLTWNPISGKATVSSNSEINDGNVEQECSSCPGNLAYFGQTNCGNTTTDLPATGSREREILDKLFDVTGGRYWNKTHDNWLKASSPICDREGVECIGEGVPHAGVDQLRLQDYGLRGTIPSDVWELPGLRSLSLTGNAVDFDFRGLSKAEKLVVVKCTRCQVRSLSGLGNAPPSLHEIHFSDNQLDGELPSDILALTNARKLFLNNNFFSGSLPSEVGGLTQLRVLHLQGNDLTGVIPSEIGLMSSLDTIDLSQNMFSGAIPFDLQKLTSLTRLNLASQKGRRKLEGSLPPFEESEFLVQLDVQSNRISGPLPSNLLAFADPTESIYLNLANNLFTGPLPRAWNRFDSLELDLSGNLINAIPSEICDESTETFPAAWNRGQVGLLGSCDAILCKPGTHSSLGRKSVGVDCFSCPGDLNGAPYFGTVECQDPSLRAERDILVQLYQKTGGETDWLTQTNWLSDDLSGVCSWYGISCTDDGHVKEIELSNNNLNGFDDPEAVDAVSRLLQLPHLKVLDLKGNQVEVDFQAIPTASVLEFMRLSNTGIRKLDGISAASQLKALHVTNNYVETLPDELFSMPNLESLYLSFNLLRGSIPRRFGALSKLKELYAFGNLLSGWIPKELADITGLRELVLSQNHLSGTLPQEFGAMAQLEQLSLFDQAGADLISGPVPSFSQAPRLWYFDASNNDFTGPLPDNFLANSIYTSDSVMIYLQNNEITGTLPLTLSKFESLDINLAGNKIVDIPPELCTIDGWLQGNVGKVKGCSGILCPSETFSDLGYSTPDLVCSPCEHLKGQPFLGQNQCEDFSVENSALDAFYEATGGDFWVNNTGWRTASPICSWYGIECGNGDLQDRSGITAVVLDENGLSGGLPSDVWELPSLQKLSLKGNPNLKVDFEGIENSAGTLEVLYLSEVSISSLDGISRASGLRHLHVTGNDIASTFPEELFMLAESLQSLFIAFNLFYGDLPTRLGELTNLESFYAYGNNFLSTIPSEVALMRNLKDLVLSENLIYGQIPSELSSMPALEVLSCFRLTKSGPKLSGSIPALDRLPQLSYLYLQGNKLRGKLTDKFLSASLGMKELDLSANKLTGTVPGSLAKLSFSSLLVHDNKMTGIEQELCDMPALNDGTVGTYGCDGIMCPPGSANSFGRSTVASPSCKACPVPSVVPYYGSLSCDGVPDERQILLNLYEDLGGNAWKRKDFWGSNLHICEWYGVACISGEVVEINLSANNLSGLPGPELFELKNLRVLWLYSNPILFSFENIESATDLEDIRLDGTLLHSVYGISNGISLANIDVSFTSLKGAFPDEILRLSNLRTLSMRGNELTGPIPESLGALPLLISLRLDSNRLSGTLPDFSGLPFLRSIHLEHNLLSGTISPNFLNDLVNHAGAFVNIAQNEITGVVPEELARFDSMTLLLRQNQLLGLPFDLCEKDKWNGGDVGDNGCDGFLCKPGTSNEFGRSTAGIECASCTAAKYYGSTDCPALSDGASILHGMSLPFLFASLFSLYLLVG